MKKILWKGIQFLFFFGLGFGLLYWMLVKFEASWRATPDKVCPPGLDDCSLLQKIGYDFTQLHWGWMFALFAAYFFSNLSRAIRWNYLIEPLGVKPRTYNTFFGVIIGYFVNILFPRAGEIAKPATVARYEKIPLDRLIGTIVMDRAVDILILLSLIGLTFLLEFQKISAFVQKGRGDGAAESGESGGFLTSPFVLVLLGLMALSALVWLFLGKTLVQMTFFQKIKQIVLGFWEGIKTVSKVKQRGWFIFHSLNIWLMYYLMVYFGFLAYAPTQNLGLVAALLVFVASSLGMLFPSPGGMGAFHLATTLALKEFYGIAEFDGFTFANIVFMFVQGLNVVIGLVAFALLPTLNRNRADSEPLPHN